METKKQSETVFQRPLSGEVVQTPPLALVPTRGGLTGNHVCLEPQNALDHADELFAASHASEQALRIWDYLAYGPWESVDSYKETLRAQSASFDPIFYTIKSLRTGKACGQASFLDINAQNGVTEIGHIWFAPELQQTPGGTEALYLMLCHAMDDLKYRRMQWRCNSLNEKSRQAARRLGFRFEGIFYNHLIFKGKNRDTAWYSILDDEWPEVRDIIAAWLKPDNFTNDYKPKTSLFETMSRRANRSRGVDLS